ncbi:MAG: hypothetical protein GC137_06095 [Alphaproteobacteria bacterium]|nr:hypothetical protein [Alphaproteobacteria bacterium]
MNLKDALKPHFVKALLRNTVGDDPDVIVRPASFFFRKKDEDEREMHRVILIPPAGYTADAPNKMNSHDEAERATIEVVGGIRVGKRGFSRLKDALLFAGKNENGKTSELDKPYMVYSIDDPDPDLVLSRHSSGEPPFHVVKPDGFGFYHNLTNTSGDWLALKLHKICRPMREVNLTPHLQGLEEGHANALKRLYQGILLHGDGVFEHMPSAVHNIEAIPIADALPALGEMLYVRDTGRHEACTAFAMILKLGRKDRATVMGYLTETLDAQTVPQYYANQLMAKIEGNTDKGTEPQERAFG